MLLPHDPRARFELDFVVNGGAATAVYRFVRDFYQRRLQDRDATARVAMAVYELLENSIKYAADGESRVRMEVTPADAKPEALLVSIRTTNRAAPTDVESLQKLFAEMEQADDRDAFYQKLLHRGATSTEGSGLGLGRIWTEGQMDVKHEVDEPWVTIEARLEVTPEVSE